jgi:hypothetical protein
MHRFWDTVVLPVFEIVQPRTIVEVGSSGGLNTKHVVGYCRKSGARFHVIDPVPLRDQALVTALEEVGTFHLGVSHDVLPRLTADLFLVDGDHNWYTVFHELRLIEEGARKAGRPLPVIVLHDVHWPYGRRDLYYAPERIPIEYRQPHARRGMVWGRAELHPEGGLNRKHDNALVEGGARNGVLTGIEDFVKQSKESWQLRTFPSFNGLAVLWSPADLPAQAAADLERTVTLPEHVFRHLQELEKERIVLLTEIRDIWRRMGGYPGPLVSRVVRIARRVTGRVTD